MYDEGVDNFHAVAVRVVSEERPALPAAARVTALTSEQVLIGDALEGIPVYVEEVPRKMVIVSKANRSGTGSHLSALLNRLVVNTFDNMRRMRATLKTTTDALLDNPGFFSLVAALIKSEHSHLITEQAKIDARCRQLVQLGTKSNRSKPAQMSEQGEETPIYILNDAKTNPRA